MTKTEIKRAVILIIMIILVVSIIKIIQSKDTTIKDLQRKGYNETEINILLENLTEEEIKNAANSKYNENLPKVISSQYYIPNNLRKYLELCEENDNIEDVIAIINTGSNNDWYTNPKAIETPNNSMLVNKFNYLLAEYNPDDLVDVYIWHAYGNQKLKKEAYNAFSKMWNAADKQGLKLIINDAYRTFEQQKNSHDSLTDKYASRPGYSEHQTGLAINIMTDSSNSFEETDEFKWLQNNSYKYGFILRYPKGKKHITGYDYEAGHFRYLGVELATKVYESGLTYDEYYAYYCEYKGEC